MSAAGTPPGPDAAWVVLESSLSAPALAAFCADLERLYRINPHLEFRSWTRPAPDRFRAELFNHSNQRAAVLEGRREPLSAHAFRVRYATGIKTSTTFAIEPAAAGSRLTITDEYAPAGEGERPEAEVDRSLHAWGVALRAHLERDQRWGRLPLYRWWVERVWLPMTPGARRITFLILVIAVADLLLIALALALYAIESAR